MGERGGGDVQQETYMYWAHAYHAGMLWELLYTRYLIPFPEHFPQGSDPQRTAERTKTNRS